MLFSAFSVEHFADTVEYSCTGFFEKNRDTVSRELVNVLRESDLNICSKLMALDDESVLDDSSGRDVRSAAKNQVADLSLLENNKILV